MLNRYPELHNHSVWMTVRGPPAALIVMVTATATDTCKPNPADRTSPHPRLLSAQPPTFPFLTDACSASCSAFFLS